jgi:hypothetical protein
MDLVYILFITFVITYFIVWCYNKFHTALAPLYFIQTDTENTPYVTIDEQFYSQNDCTDLLDQINHSGFVVSNPLNELFTNTKGFLLKFVDHVHLKNEFQEHKANFIYDVFTKVKNPACNAFICNVLIMLSRNKVSDYLQSTVIDKHRDCSIEITEKYFPNRTYLPKCVSVLYLQTPNTFTDGELELYTFLGLSVKPEQMIKPKIGKLVTFRGDLLHSVKSFHSSEDTPRISIVFEQYIIPPHLLPSKTFEFLSKTY